TRRGMEQWQLVGLITRRSGVRIPLPQPQRARGWLASGPRLLPPSSSGPGRGPFKAEIGGSNPPGGTSTHLPQPLPIVSIAHYTGGSSSPPGVVATNSSRDGLTPPVAP